MNETVASLFEQSQFHMADITRKAPSFRRAIATGRIFVGSVGFARIKDRTLPKGDALKLAEIAGVQGRSWLGNKSLCATHSFWIMLPCFPNWIKRVKALSSMPA